MDEHDFFPKNPQKKKKEKKTQTNKENK